VSPRDDVATHCVDVPVERRTIPYVPEALPLSRSAPVRLRLEAKRLVADTPVVEALVITAKPVVVRLVVDAFMIEASVE
jgi:hypothetical protein